MPTPIFEKCLAVSWDRTSDLCSRMAEMVRVKRPWLSVRRRSIIS